MILAEYWKELLFPRKCVLCGRILNRQESDICRECRCSVPEYECAGMYPYLDGQVALWYYEGCVRESLLRFKFHNRPDYADAYGPLLALRILRCLPESDVITWVPVSKKRLRERGYDQSERIARAVAKELGIPVERLLDKIRDNPAQSGIDNAEERTRNVQGVYQVHPDAEVSGKRVLLIDDILTTGATAGECARMLREAGAHSLVLAAVAAGRKNKQK